MHRNCKYSALRLLACYFGGSNNYSEDFVNISCIVANPNHKYTVESEHRNSFAVVSDVWLPVSRFSYNSRSIDQPFFYKIKMMHRILWKPVGRFHCCCYVTSDSRTDVVSTKRPCLLFFYFVNNAWTLLEVSVHYVNQTLHTEPPTTIFSMKPLITQSSPSSCDLRPVMSQHFLLLKSHITLCVVTVK